MAAGKKLDLLLSDSELDLAHGVGSRQDGN